MNYISLNCRGLGNPHTVRDLNDMVRDRKLEILFLVETISLDRRIEEMCVKLGFASYFSVDRVG